MADQIVVVKTTVGNAEEARTLADALVGENLVACAQCTSAAVESTYVWKGELHHESEIQVWLKTSVDREPTVRDRLSQLHPYDVPEILSWTVRANSAYAAWVRRACNPL